MQTSQNILIGEQVFRSIFTLNSVVFPTICCVLMVRNNSIKVFLAFLNYINKKGWNRNWVSVFQSPLEGSPTPFPVCLNNWHNSDSSMDTLLKESLCFMFSRGKPNSLFHMIIKSYFVNVNIPFKGRKFNFATSDHHVAVIILRDLQL